MKKNTDSLVKLLLMACAFMPSYLFAADMNLETRPLAILTSGTTPNIMLLLDDSGSMAWSDVDYSPGYDADQVYKCDDTIPVLPSLGAASAVVTYISLEPSYEGVPYFSYNNVLYGWGTLTGAVSNTTPEIAFNKNLSRVCFDPEQTYQFKRKAEKKGSTTVQEEVVGIPTTPDRTIAAGDMYCPDSNEPSGVHQTYTPQSGSLYVLTGYFLGFFPQYGWVYSNNVCNPGSQSSYRAVVATETIFIPGVPIPGYEPPSYIVDYYYSIAAPTSEQTGNYLNWYFSATLAEWADDTATGGYKNYNEALTGHGFWTEEVAKNFIYQNTTFNFSKSEDTQIHGSKTNPANSKTWFPVEAASTSSSLSNSSSLKGLKPGVFEYLPRITVAKDVSKMLTRKLKRAKLGIAAMHSKVSYNAGTGKYSSDSGSGDGGMLVHGLVVLDKTSTDTTVLSNTASNQLSLVKSISVMDGSGGTPTAEAISGVASYLLQGYGEESSPIGISGRKIKQSLPSSMLLYTAAPHVSTTTPNIIPENWCAKNIIVTLTDGKPENDNDYPSDFEELWPTGLVAGTSVDTAGSGQYNQSGIVRVPGGLYDNDWLSMRGKQNIETFFIAMGSGDITGADVFKKAGMAGGGGNKNYYPASDGAAILAAFNSIIQKANAASSSVTAVAVSAVSELKTNNMAFQATYATEFWNSSIKSIGINADGYFVNPDNTGASKTTAGITPVWEANKVLSSMYLLNDTNILGKNVAGDYRSISKRKVYTWSGSTGMRFGSSTMTKPASSSATLTEFNNLPKVLRDDIDVSAKGNAQERYNLMMYLLGDVTNESNSPISTGNKKYRQRGNFGDNDNGGGDNLIDAVNSGGIFGDVVHSSPVYVQVPPRPWDDANYGAPGKRYSAFRTSQEDRPAMIYVGANDGMLHGITVASGTKDSISYPAGGELFAYIPSMLGSTEKKDGLHYISSPAYEHRYYVDLTVSPSDVFVDFYTGSSSARDLEWRTVLVGGLRGGGKGLYALDVTCPFVQTGNTCSNESFNASNILWEFSAADDADLGFTFSEPIIAKVNYDSGFTTAKERNGNGVGRWAAIVGNGYNSTNGRAAVYILFLDGGIDGTWTEGVDYLKIYVSDSTTDNASSKNGMSSPQAVDSNGDGLTDRIYAGDLKGQMWSIDIKQKSTKALYNAGTSPWVVNKLFTTGANASTTQAITTPPMVARDTSVSANEPNLMVIFATGKYLEESDLDDKSMHAIYAVHDRGVYNLNRYTNAGSSTKKLLERRVFIEEAPLTVGDETIVNRKVVGDQVDAAIQFGWYAELASDLNKDGAISGSSEIKGERVAYNPFLAGRLFVFNTVIPKISSCSGSTEGWTMLIDWVTGLAPLFESYDANLSGDLDPLDKGYAGFFNEAAGSQLGRGGDNIYDSTGDEARRLGVNFGSQIAGQRLGWEERFPFGVSN